VDIKDIECRVAEFDELFSRIEDDGEDFDDELAAIPRMDPSRYLAFLTERAKTPYGQAFAQFREFVAARLLDAFARMSDDDRRAVLDLFSSYDVARIALWSLLDEYRWRFQKSPPQEKSAVLRHLLLIAVLTEEYLEEVETAMILTSVWGYAEECELDPGSFFKEAAEVAGRRKLSHGQSAYEILRDFEPYDYGGSAV
jgi:hypothetical protein